MHSFCALRHARRSSRFKQKTLKGYCVAHVNMCVFSFHAHGDENSVISTERSDALTRVQIFGSSSWHSRRHIAMRCVKLTRRFYRYDRILT